MLTCLALALAGFIPLGDLGVTAQRFTGRVLSVTDGDTVEVARGRGQVTVRLHGIDAPEGGQPYGAEATAVLRKLVLDRLVEVTMRDVDTYGRIVAEVSVNGDDVGEALVRSGAAWHSVRYSASDRLAAAEREARVARRGLWAERSPVAPWEFRDADSKRLSAVPATGGPYHGNRESKVFHAPGCQYYECKNCTVLLRSKDQAKAAGFRPHTQCVK